MTLFNHEYSQQLKEAWKIFIQQGEDQDHYDFSFIRPVIFESWLRSRNYQVDPYSRPTSILNPEEIQRRIQKNQLLIKTVRPYMEQLYSIVEGSGYYLMLSDAEGYILDLIGDKDMIEQGKENLLIVGAYRNETVSGTNAIGTCLAIRRPIQIWDGEHYNYNHKHYSCSSAPIFDESGDLVGCLNITGQFTEIHTHTLGMVLSAVDGITKEMKIRKAYQEIETISAQRNSLLESVSSGLVLLNEEDEVIQINGNAARILHLNQKTVIGRKLSEYISLDKSDSSIQFYNLEREYQDKETDVYFKGSDQIPVKLRISVSFVGEGRNHDRGAVIRFDESQYIHKLVNKVGGFKATYTFGSIIGESSAVKNLITTCTKAAQSTSNVLILGESGTGKELVAQAIHNSSVFSNGPFVAINCAALPKTLIESELFGYEKGAFTGANKEGNPGKFELAENGTIFLDEIGDMPLDVQATLLRVIQTREIIRLGGVHPKKINVRVIAATNSNLADAVEEKAFRQDLYYRLNVINIPVPPLRFRGEDIILLANYFVRTMNNPGNRNITIHSSVYPALMNYPWPGNVRELENAMERAINISDGDEIRLEHLPVQLLQNQTQSQGEAIAVRNDTLLTHSESQTLAEQNLIHLQTHIQTCLQQCDGNVKRAAELLGISRRTLYRKMDKYGIDFQKFRD